MDVHEQPHQLRDGHYRVGIVEMHGLTGRELAQIATISHEARQDALQRGTDKKVLLLEAQFLASSGVVVRVKNLGDGFVQGLLLHRSQIIAMVEVTQIEGVAGHCPP